VSEPTQGEREFAQRFRFEPTDVASARDALNAIALLPWPEPERVSLLRRLARAARADVGDVLGRLALRTTPLPSFDRLIPLPGLADKRVAGLVRALRGVDVAAFNPDAATIRALRAALDAARAENALLRAELDRWRAQVDATGEADTRPTVMRLGDVASSAASQTSVVVEALKTRPSGLRLTGVELRMEGAAASVGDDVALDFAVPQGGSAVNLSFVSADAPGSRTPVDVPDVVGYTPALARRKLAAVGFEAKFSNVAGGTGVVADQTPNAGTLAQSGSVVRLLLR
jgi:hypothetical protein